MNSYVNARFRKDIRQQVIIITRFNKYHTLRELVLTHHACLSLSLGDAIIQIQNGYVLNLYI